MANSNNHWKILNKYNEKLSLETVMFFYSQAEIRLTETIEISDTITNRSYTLLSLSIALITASVGYILNHLVSGNGNIALFTTSIVSLLYLIVTLVTIIVLIFPGELKVVGSAPKNIIDYKFINNYKKDKLHKAYRLAQIQNFQMRIEYNSTKNFKRSKQLQIVIALLAATPIFSIIVFSVIFFIS